MGKGGVIMSHKVRDIMKYRKFARICLFISIPINIINTALKIEFLTIIGVTLLIIFITTSLIFWRCPCCKKRLPIRFDNLNEIDDIYVCPYCSTKFLNGNIMIPVQKPPKFLV